MESNVPATTDEAAVPATMEAGGRPSPAAPAPRQRQNIATGLFPMALGLMVLVFLALAFWTLMTATGTGL